MHGIALQIFVNKSMDSFLNASSNDSSIKFAVVIWNNFHVGCDHIVIINIKFY
jgi:hypothetical protein